MANMPLVRLPPGVPTSSMRQGVFVWPAGHAPTPLLADDFDLFWVMRGGASLTLSDGRMLRAKADEFMILPPFVGGTIDQTKAPLTFTFFHFTFRPITAPARRDPAGIGSVSRAIDVPMEFTRRQAPGVWRAMRAMNKLDPKQRDYDWKLETATIDIVRELASFGERRRRNADEQLFHSTEPPDARIAVITNRIQSEPARAWSVAELATSVGLSPSRVHALCCKMLGRSLKSHIVRTRLQHALMLLRERKHEEIPSIKEVSVACGFSSQHFFSRQFKAMFGVSPMEYRDSAIL